MVFENVTLFELHLENARFRAGTGEEESGVEESVETDEDGGGGRGIGGLLALLLIVGVGVGLLARRRRAGDEGAPAEADQISIEQAVDQ